MTTCSMAGRAGTLFGLLIIAATPVTAQLDSVAVPPVESYLVGQASPPADTGREIVALSLEDAMAVALEANLGLRSSRLDPILQAWSRRAAAAAFRPTVSTSLGMNNATQQSTSQLDGASTITTERATLNTSLSQALPWYGGRLSANFNNARTETNNSFATRNPSYSSNFSLNFTQPLLAGFGADNQRATLETQDIQTQIAELQLDAEARSLVDQVRRAYWSLRASLEQIEIQQRALDQSLQLLDENRTRERLGRVTRYQVVQSEAQVASAEQALLAARIQWRNQELAFKQLLVAGANDPLLAQTIDPVTQPVLVEVEVDIDAAIARALANRTDLRVQREQRRISEVNLEVSESSSLPTLDLSGSYSLSGVGGDIYARSELGGDPILVAPGGYGDGLGAIGDFDNPTWSLSLSASYPLGINPGRANLERARLQLRQQEIALQQQELTVVTQVTAAGLAVENTWLQYGAAQRTREASEQNLAAELARWRLGVATNFELLTAQNQLTSARLSELQSLIAHINAINDFERVQTVGN